MRFFDATWMDIERYLENDDRVVLPLGSTEQHAYLSLGVDSILSERVSTEAAEPLGVPVLPAMPFGLVPYFAAYPGSPSLRIETYLAVVRDLLDSLHAQGFNRFLIVNGHGGNSPAAGVGPEWMGDNPNGQVLFHNWWNGPRTWSVVQRLDPVAGHASWLENFPWTRLPGVEAPAEGKPMIDVRRLAVSGPAEVRELLEDGSYGGRYQRPDDEMLEMWQTGVEEVRELLESGWR
ncbi:MAG: creatinine amidohydrolase [Gaiellales bacterium]|jgi:creatinine amidohydrolase|nr:creatinine amidohydrolase [Gaiellales bacterium]